MSEVGRNQPILRRKTGLTLAHGIVGKPARKLTDQMSAPYTIREYIDGDAEAMAQIYYRAARELGPRRYSQEQVMAWAPDVPDAGRFAARASDGRLTLLAVNCSGEIVAFGDLEPDGHIDFLYCQPEAAGTGAAAQVLDTLLQRATLTHSGRLFVEASELARGLFERRGFVLVQRRDFELNGISIHNYLLERRQYSAAVGTPVNQLSR